MYLFYSGSNSGVGKEYAYVAVSSRSEGTTSMDTMYLGSVLDKSLGIYKSKKRGVFHFDTCSGNIEPVSDSYVPPPNRDSRKKSSSVSVDFGDAFFVDTFLHTSGFVKIIDSIEYGNPDTLHTMILFYILSGVANYDAIHWYEGSIVRLLYPKANLTSQRISDFLSSIGTENKQLAFQTSYVKYIMDKYSSDKNILIDSTGLKNSIHCDLTNVNVHNGKVSNEIRLIFVVQKSTGIPIYYKAIPENIVDVSTLSRILLHLNSLKIEISSCILDAGYNSSDNLDLFYNENHSCVIDFITRVRSNDKLFKKMINEELGFIDEKDNFIKFEDRYLFLKKKQVMIGSNKDNPAWLYLGLDCNRMSDELKNLMHRAKKYNLTNDQIYDALQTEGLFGILSSSEYKSEEILPAYYQRQAAEQIFDFAKNYTKLLPLRTNNIHTFNGHLLLSYIATCAVKLIQLNLKETNVFFGSRFICLRNQKCTIYADKIVTDPPQKIANDTYKIFNIKCPDAISIKDGILNHTYLEYNTIINKEKNTKTTSNKKRGCPKGLKNKNTLEKEKDSNIENKKRQGRARGAKKTELTEEKKGKSSH